MAQTIQPDDVYLYLTGCVYARYDRDEDMMGHDLGYEEDGLE